MLHVQHHMGLKILWISSCYFQFPPRGCWEMYMNFFDCHTDCGTLLTFGDGEPEMFSSLMDSLTGRIDPPRISIAH